ncbi:MAG TPA: 50S ribosomal protein L1 [Oligoflexia bacterium]|nr:50S ribosomal protein L1 [Oligoflexia bacterium]HMP26395.1 50S ribosomal protein L1 [Oligoflexia bacterium]
MSNKDRKLKSKRVRSLVAKYDQSKTYSLQEGCQLVAGLASAKFDETVEIALKLGVDPKKSDQNVRGSVPLPNGLGKKIRVLVFAKGEKIAEAQGAGADEVGGDDLVEKIQKGFSDFDVVVATPDMMVAVGKVGKVLGPRGLMPSPKIGTVTFDVGNVVRSLKSGRAEFRVEKAGIVQAQLGKASFGAEKIYENAQALIAAVNKAKPSTSKGIYLQSASLSLTMSPSVHLDPAPLRNI